MKNSVHKRLSVAVMGCGNWGKNLVRVMSGLESVDLKWIVDTNPVALALAHDRAPESTPVSHIEKTGYAFDAAVIATPALDHVAHARSLLMRGKDVLVEKPIATSHESFTQLAAFAKRDSLQLMVGHQLLYHPVFVQLQEMVSCNAIGEIQSIVTERTGFVDMNKEPGVIWSYGPHDISMVLALINDMPLTVRGAGKKEPTGSELPTCAEIDLGFAQGKIAQIHLAREEKRRSRLVTVNGTFGSLMFDDSCPGGMLTHIDRRNGVEQSVIETGQDEPLLLECSHFVDRCVDRAPPLTGLTHAERVTVVLARISKSILTE